MSNTPNPFGSPADQIRRRPAAWQSPAWCLGLLSFLTCLLAGIPAIGTGIVGLANISSSKGQLQGRGLAIAGIVMGSDRLGIHIRRRNVDRAVAAGNQ